MEIKEKIEKILNESSFIQTGVLGPWDKYGHKSVTELKKILPPSEFNTLDKMFYDLFDKVTEAGKLWVDMGVPDKMFDAKSLLNYMEKFVTIMNDKKLIALVKKTKSKVTKGK